MKKITLLTAVLWVVVFALSGCGAQGGAKDERVNIAFSELDKQWDGDYQIKNTRIITLKDNDVSMFEGIDYIVEFVLYTNYFDTAPYYCNAGIYDTVSVYKDGSAEVNERDLFSLYRSRSFVTDYSDIIDDIKDLGSTYNN